METAPYIIQGISLNNQQLSMIKVRLVYKVVRLETLRRNIRVHLTRRRLKFNRVKVELVIIVDTL